MRYRIFGLSGDALTSNTLQVFDNEVQSGVIIGEAKSEQALAYGIAIECAAWNGRKPGDL